MRRLLSFKIAENFWRPQGDLNPCRRRERPVSWTGLDDGDACGLTPAVQACSGGSCGIRTRDSLLKRQVLYRTELTTRHRRRAETLQAACHGLPGADGGGRAATSKDFYNALFKKSQPPRSRASRKPGGKPRLQLRRPLRLNKTRLPSIKAPPRKVPNPGVSARIRYSINRNKSGVKYIWLDTALGWGLKGAAFQPA